MEIKQLLNLIADDSQYSFKQFYDLYYDQVFRFSYYYLKKKELCREVVTNVFFSVWQSRKKLQDISNIETYLYVTVRNEANRYLAKRNNEWMVSLEDIPGRLEVDNKESAEYKLISSEVEELLTRAINELPEKCRTIFLMVREERLKPKTIAEILSIQESTVRVQLKTAIEKIVTALKPHFPDLLFSPLLSLLL